MPEHRPQRARFPAVDVHCHWGLEQDPAALLAAMDARNVRRAVNLSGGSGEKLDAMLARFVEGVPEGQRDRLILLCNVDFERIDEPGFAEAAVAGLEDAKARGVRGLKVFKSLGLYHRDAAGELVAVDDPRLDPIWAACGRLGFPVLIHTADPAAFWDPIDRHNERWLQLKRHPDWGFHGTDAPPRDQLLAQRDRVIARHGGTNFIGAHVANNAEDLARVSADLERFPNLFCDISGRVGELGRQPYSARAFFLRFPDRILYGTDRFPGRADQPREAIYFRFLETFDESFLPYDHPFPPSGDWRIFGLGLPDGVLRKVYHENAERLLGLAAGD